MTARRDLLWFTVHYHADGDAAVEARWEAYEQAVETLRATEDAPDNDWWCPECCQPCPFVDPFALLSCRHCGRTFRVEDDGS